jgi:hypothetical protein
MVPLIWESQESDARRVGISRPAHRYQRRERAVRRGRSDIRQSASPCAVPLSWCPWDGGTAAGRYAQAKGSLQTRRGAFAINIARLPELLEKSHE